MAFHGLGTAGGFANRCRLTKNRANLLAQGVRFRHRNLACGGEDGDPPKIRDGQVNEIAAAFPCYPRIPGPRFAYLTQTWN